MSVHCTAWWYWKLSGSPPSNCCPLRESCTRASPASWKSLVGSMKRTWLGIGVGLGVGLGLGPGVGSMDLTSPSEMKAAGTRCSTPRMRTQMQISPG